MPRRYLANPKTNVSSDTGSGAFAPSDREFQEIRLKAKDVLDGNDVYTYEELSKLVARLLEGR